MIYTVKLQNGITDNTYLYDKAYLSIDEVYGDIENIKKELAPEISIIGIVKLTENEASETASDKKYDLTDDGKGKKYDNGKSMVGTLCRVFPRALLGIGQCIEFGTRKYPKPDNWKLVEGAFTRYQDSMMRHYLKFLAGQEKDSETNLLHLKHMVWNALAILELYLMEHEDETLFD